MIPTATNSTDLLNLASNEGLFQALLEQIKKDFALSGQSFELESVSTASDLLVALQRELKRLIDSNFDAYLQLLYRVDIPERMMQSDAIQDSDALSEKSTFAILQREWKKVYYRNKYS